MTRLANRIGIATTGGAVGAAGGAIYENSDSTYGQAVGGANVIGGASMAIGAFYDGTPDEVAKNITKTKAGQGYAAALRKVADVALDAGLVIGDVIGGIPMVAKPIANNIMARTINKPDKTVQDMVFTRSLDLEGSFTSDRKLRYMFEGIENKSKREVCATLKDQYLGNAGVYIKGKVGAAYSMDAGTLSIKGKAISLNPDLTMSKSSVKTAKDFDQKIPGSTPWSEINVAPESIEGIWMSESASKSIWYQGFREEAEKRGYSIDIIPDSKVIIKEGESIMDHVNKAGENRAGITRLMARLKNLGKAGKKISNIASMMGA